MTEILRFDPRRRTNAQAILDLHALGYLKDEDLTLDATYGKGRFWKLWRPEVLVDNDIDPECGRHHVDYRDLSELVDLLRFDVTVFDPPYKLNGTGGSHPSDEGYAVDDKWTDRTDDTNAGLSECLRVTRPGGLILHKTMDQVAGGKCHWLSKRQQIIGRQIGGNVIEPVRERAVLVDELYVNSYRKQPKRKCKACDGTGWRRQTVEPMECWACETTGKVECPQKHARSNVSVLQVYRKA